MISKKILDLVDTPEVFTPPAPEQQRHVYEKRGWYVHNLIGLAESMPSFEKPLAELRAMALESVFPGSTAWTYAELAYHYKVAMEADMSYPILLGEDGRIMDGHHRLLKALIQGNDTILVVQFVIDPTPDFYLD